MQLRREGPEPASRSESGDGSSRVLRPILPALAGLLACGAVACSQAPGEVAPKHVVLISIDTLRRDHLSLYGYQRETTPHIDSLARSGIVFENAFAANTNTAPSHASMLTGLHPHEHGILRNGYELRAEVETLAESLGEGYARAAFVSGYPLQRSLTNLDRGFEHYDDDFGSDWQRTAERSFARAEGWLKSRGDDRRPILLFFHLYDPHHPYDAPADFATRFLPVGQSGFRFPVTDSTYADFWKGDASPAEFDEYVARYDGEIAYADHYVGRLRTTLEDLGYWEEALVLLISDHGETLDERAAPFTHGGRVYDEQIRVPFVLRLPGDRYAGKRVVEQVHHIDLLPTILDLLGRDVEPEVSGRSTRSLFEADPQQAEEHPVFSTALPQAWRVPEVDAEFRSDVLVSSIRTRSWKLIAYPGVDAEILQLFDLEQDAGETQDVARSHAQERIELSRALDAWRISAAGFAPPPALRPEQEAGLRALGYLDTATPEAAE